VTIPARVRTTSVSSHDNSGIPIEFADDGFGIRVEKKLVCVEAVTMLRLVEPVHAIAVDRATTVANRNL
jgi:hypothetical protein